MAILFVDKNIPDYVSFLDHVGVDIKTDLGYYNECIRIGFVWENNHSLMPFGSKQYKNSNIFTQEFIDFISLYDGKTVTIDLISCLLKQEIKINEISGRTEIDEISAAHPNIKINYSDDLVGNSPRGSWILESSSEDIQKIYFKDSIIEYPHVLGLPSSGSLGPNFSYSDVSDIRTFTLTTDFTIDNSSPWAQIDINYSDNVHQVIIDGNNHIITIAEDDFAGLFYAGNYFVGNNKPTIIKNLFIKATVNILVAIAKIEGNIEFENCHLELIGNINNQGGGLAHNNASGSETKVVMTNCSVKIFGKIGNNAGPLIGYISYNSGNIYTIDKCYSVVADNDSLSGITLSSSSGAFVGSGISNTVNITNSFCLFNGSMGTGSGIVAGKFLGSSDTLTISKFYAVTNITYVIDGSDAGSAGNYGYNLSSYFGGSPPSSFAVSNFNILNLGINLTNMYSVIGTLYPTLTGANKFTDYTSFASSAHTAGAKIGSQEYIITINSTNRTFYIYTTSYNNDWWLDLSTDILKGVSALSAFSISNQPVNATPFTPVLPVVIAGNGTVTYSSNNLAVATVNSSTGLITILSIGSVIITATISGTDYYLTNSTSATFTVYELPCLTADTMVLTPVGYYPVTALRKGDSVITSDKRVVQISAIYKSIVNGNSYTFPCLIPANSIAPNYPVNDLTISQGHLIKYKKYWILPKLHFELDTSFKKIEYYHIKLKNYITDHLVINNGFVVESLGNNPLGPKNIEYIKESRKRRSIYSYNGLPYLSQIQDDDILF